jgi:hypothetical protein
VLPKDYGIFEPKVLEDLMRLFNSEQIKRATGDVFGRIYEYFLAKFSIQKAHDNGEFFTPSSLVQMIVNVIEPDHGNGLRPRLRLRRHVRAVQPFHRGRRRRRRPKKVVFYGQEKNRDTIRIAKMNLAVHGLEGKIAEAITYYQDEHNLSAAATSSWPTRPSTWISWTPTHQDRPAPALRPAGGEQGQARRQRQLPLDFLLLELPQRPGPRRLRHVLPGLQRRPWRKDRAPEARRDRRRGRDDLHQGQLLLHAHRALRALALRPQQTPDRDQLLAALTAYTTRHSGEGRNPDNTVQHATRRAFDPHAEALRGLVKQVDLLYKLAARVADQGAELATDDAISVAFDRRATGRLIKQLDEQRKAAVEQMKQAVYFHRQMTWLHDRFPDAELVDVPGLVKLASRAEIEAADWSLTPGRYVGVAPPEEDEDLDFEQTLRDIHTELADLNREAAELAARIQGNFEELGA